MRNKNLLQKDTKVVYASGLEGKKEIHQYIEDNFHVLGVPLTEFDNISSLDKIDHSLLNNNIKIPEITYEFNYKYLSKSYDSSGGMRVGNDLTLSSTYFPEIYSRKDFFNIFYCESQYSNYSRFQSTFHCKEQYKVSISSCWLHDH